MQSREDKLRALFPSLKAGHFKITSDPTINYNCIAWAAGVNDTWWEPDSLKLFYWPANIPRQYTLAAYRKAYETIGYKKCPTGDPEQGWDKIAIFSKGKMPTHAAKLLPSNVWSSKCGNAEDIEHDLDGVSGLDYGIPAFFMRRKAAS